MEEVLKEIYKKIIYGYKGSSRSYISYLKKKGVSIGENVTFYEPNTNYIDTQKPWLITIGNNVEITRGVVMVTHDYAWSVLKQLTGEMIGSRGKITIGNNVFIGMNTTILQGVAIGDNVIIGANSLINKDIESNRVAAGNPVRVISDIDTYQLKRKRSFVNEAKELFAAYYRAKGEIPPKEIFDEFFWIFEKRTEALLPPAFKEKLKLTGNGDLSLSIFLKTDPIYDGYEKFVEECMRGVTL